MKVFNSLKKRDQLFLREFVIDFDTTRAARAVGFSTTSANASGNRLLQREDMMVALGELTAATEEKLSITKEKVIAELSKIALADRRRIVDDEGRMKSPHELDEELAACVEGYSVGKNGVEIKMASKLPALRALGEHFNVFEDHEANKKPNVQVHINGKLAEL